MLNINTNQKIYVIPMPISTDYCIVNSRIEYKGKQENTILTYITEEEEQKLDAGKILKIKRGKRTFTITDNDIYCYGEVDFHEGSDDCETINSFSFLNYLGSSGICVPSDYNYDKHECHSPLPSYRYTETFQPSVLCRYAHGCLGKPKRVILFRRFVW